MIMRSDTNPSGSRKDLQTQLLFRILPVVALRRNAHQHLSSRCNRARNHLFEGRGKPAHHNSDIPHTFLLCSHSLGLLYCVVNIPITKKSRFTNCKNRKVNHH